MKVLVLGATGFLGPAIMRRLAATGHEPIGLSRHAGPGILAADRRDPRAMAALAEAHRADALIDLLAMTLEETRPLLDALAGRIGRYVLVSSGDVYRQYGALNRKERLGPGRPSLDEDAPLRAQLHPYRSDPPRAADDPLAWMDAYDKIPIERAAASADSLSSTTVRLPMVYGPGDRQRRFAWAIRPMSERRATLDLDDAWAGWRTSYGYVDDVAAGIGLCAVHAAGAGRVYNLGPLDSPDNAAWAARFADALDWRGQVRRIAREAVDEPLRSRLNAMDLTYPLALDSRRIRTELGYGEVTDPEEALARTIEDEMRRA